MSNTFGTLNRVFNNNTVRQDDDCEFCGRLLATKLRAFLESDRKDIMLEIDKMVVNRRTKKQNTRTDSYIHTNNRPLSSQSSYQSEWSY